MTSERMDTEAARRLLREQEGCRFVAADEFRALLLSRRRLERSDHPAARVRGLHDRTTGRHFLIAEESLSAGA